MVKTAMRAAALTSAAVALTGCNVLGVNFSDDKVQYESSTSRAPLENPPDLTSIPNAPADRERKRRSRQGRNGSP